ncbi:hypothetical protein [Desulfofalx alkaliphila]|uniref:hypothetical protein n=1 Tax=Desulfofalx alkaliphila TaxID=105483 RepID=UPI0004E0E9D9|nr:hypothetical protein [Desulfofalx alkaliphila]
MNDCDYCSQEIVNLEEFEAEDGTVRSLKIVYLPKYRHIQVKIIDNEGMSINFGIDKRINYCPMCGRKLIYRI